MTTVAPGLLRLCLEIDDASWDLADALLEGMDAVEARRTAWDATLLCAALLLRLRAEHSIDLDALVAEAALARYAAAERLEGPP